MAERLVFFLDDVGVHPQVALIFLRLPHGLDEIPILVFPDFEQAVNFALKGRTFLLFFIKHTI